MSEALNRMVEAAGVANLISGFKPVPIAQMVDHLEFVDDTLIFCTATLLCFEVVSGLKVNCFKSKLIGVGGM